MFYLLSCPLLQQQTSLFGTVTRLALLALRTPWLFQIQCYCNLLIMYEFKCSYIYRPQTKFAKVMFLQASVCPRGDMHGCSGGVRGCSRGWGVRGCSGGGMHGCSRRGRVWLLLGGGHAWLLLGGACMVFSMRYGQWAGGTHPTGMHSCWENYSRYLSKRNKTHEHFHISSTNSSNVICR